VAKAEIKKASLEGKPNLELQLRRTWWSQPARYGLRAQMNLPLYDHGKVRSQIRAARRRLEVSEKLLEEAKRRAKVQKEAAALDYQAALKRYEESKAILESLRELYQKMHVGYEQKAVTYLEILEIMRTLEEGEENLADAKLNLDKAWIAQLRAEGRMIYEP
jgi:outer membrane protein TolC